MKKCSECGKKIIKNKDIYYTQKNVQPMFQKGESCWCSNNCMYQHLEKYGNVLTIDIS
jgi:hypothetical protein